MTAKEYARKYYRKRYQERKAAGLCPLCTQPARPGGTYCETHAKYFRGRYARIAKANIAKGLCACGASPEEGHKMCRICRIKQRQATERWLAKKKKKGCVAL